jgi:LPS export ABC transporter protein LptC
MISKPYFATLFFLMTSAALSTWLVIDTRLESRVTSSNLSTNPDQYMNNVTFNRTDQNGNIQDAFTATHMVHYLRDDATDFSQPDLLIFNPGQAPWHVTAALGHAVQNFNVVTISQDVKIEQSASVKRPHTVITTSSLTIYPKQKLAVSDQPVTAIQPGLEINSIGLRADMLHNTVDLLSQVRGYRK